MLGESKTVDISYCAYTLQSVDTAFTLASVPYLRDLENLRTHYSQKAALVEIEPGQRWLLTTARWAAEKFKQKCPEAGVVLAELAIPGKPDIKIISAAPTKATRQIFTLPTTEQTSTLPTAGITLSLPTGEDWTENATTIFKHLLPKIKEKPTEYTVCKEDFNGLEFVNGSKFILAIVDSSLKRKSPQETAAAGRRRRKTTLQPEGAVAEAKSATRLIRHSPSITHHAPKSIFQALSSMADISTEGTNFLPVRFPPLASPVSSRTPIEPGTEVKTGIAISPEEAFAFYSTGNKSVAQVIDPSPKR